jgi:steroid delta-isomerase-like uncharacterized protein
MRRSNEAVATMFLKLAWKKGHLNLLSEYVCKDFQYFTTFNERVLNFFEYVVYVTAFRQAMPDMELTIEDTMVKGSKAIVHSIISGSIQKPFFGLPASDKIITFSAMSTFEIESGKVKSLDSLIDMAGIQRQLTNDINNDFPLEIGPETER